MDCMPRYDQAFTGQCEQNLQDTMQLKQRFFDGKNKRVSKAKDKKEGIQSSVHVVSFCFYSYWDVWNYVCLLFQEVIK